MAKKLFLVFTTVLLSLLLFSLASADISFSEVMAKNGVFINHDTPDWVELYNDGPKDVSLDGWYLSDQKKNPTLWAFPKGSVIKAGGYALIYCTDEAAKYTQRIKSSVFFANFKLSVKGETVYLTNKDGETVDKLKYPAQYGNVSWGKGQGTGEWGFFNTATPGSRNEYVVHATMAEAPVIDTAPGFYKDEVLVSVSCDDPVFYTTDGSDPTPASKRYTEPVHVSKTTVLKFRACPSNKVYSYPVYGTYFINEPSPVAVVSMNTDKEYLTGSKGLFVAGNGKPANYNQEWEYPMSFELFDENGTRQLAQKGSFRIVGTSTRGARLKAVAVTARDNYGDPDAFNYNPFEDRDYESYHTLVVRPTGSDAVAARMRDAFLTRLSNGLGIMYQASKLCTVYYNGVYYGQYFLREKVNKYSVAQWEGISDKAIIDQIDIVEGEAREEQVMNGSRDEWLELRTFVKTKDLTIPENLQYVTDRLDVDSLFTWACYEMLILNTDLENVRVYRIPGGKWKYILYDLDDGMQTTNLQAVYMLIDSSRAGKRVSSHYSLLNRLLKIPEMKDRFLKKLAQVVQHSFIYDNHSKLLADEFIEALDVILPRHFQVNNKAQLDYSTWKQNTKVMKYSLRVVPKKVVEEVSKILNLNSAEKDFYFGETLALLKEHNSEDKQ